MAKKSLQLIYIYHCSDESNCTKYLQLLTFYRLHQAATWLDSTKIIPLFKTFCFRALWAQSLWRYALTKVAWCRGYVWKFIHTRLFGYQCGRINLKWQTYWSKALFPPSPNTLMLPFWHVSLWNDPLIDCTAFSADPLHSGTHKKCKRCMLLAIHQASN
jgi:hypothetical protein